DPAHLGLGVTAVSTGALSFFMRHCLCLECQRRALALDVLDQHRRVLLAMTGLAAIALAAAVLVDEQLLAQLVGMDHAGDFGASDARLADLHLLAIGDEQHREGDLGTLVSADLLDAQALALGDAVLFASGLDNSVHVVTGSS